MTKQSNDARYRNTRQRILNAARFEIVQHGFAGASINRIAKEAGTSKERIYKYFKNKAALLEEIVKERVMKRDSAVYFSADNLLGYVSDLFDYFAQHPNDVRLFHWLALEAEKTETKTINIRSATLSDRVKQVARAQEKGLIDSYWEPLNLLNLIVSIAMAWATSPLAAQQVNAINGQSKEQLSVSRDSAREAARRLITP